jgi:hypothetical protein
MDRHEADRSTTMVVRSDMSVGRIALTPLLSSSRTHPHYELRTNTNAFKFVTVLSLTFVLSQRGEGWVRGDVSRLYNIYFASINNSELINSLQKVFLALSWKSFPDSDIV